MFFIPFGGAGKKRLLVCDNCKREYDEQELSDNKKHDLANSKIKIKTPFYHYTGLLVIGLSVVSFFIYSFVAHEINEANYIKYLNSPMIGDYYVFDNEKCQIYEQNKTETNDKDKMNYYVLKLIALKKDQYFFNTAKYIYKSLYYAEKAIEENKNHKEFFYDNVVYIEKDKLMKFLLDNGLYIHRI
jgi:hypothetical protein